MPTQFISGVFKIHNPTGRRRAVLDHVFEQYTSAMIDLLDQAKKNLGEIREQGKYRLIDKETGEVKSEKYTEKSISQALPKPSRIEADMASCLKEALVKNVASMLASYLELDEGDKQEAGFPVSRDPSPQAWPNALAEFASAGCDLEAENETRAKLMKISRGNVMPVHFSRSRDFAILADKNHERFFLWLKLLPANSNLAQKIVINGDNLMTVGQCNKLQAGEIFNYQGKSGLLFPIQLGRRHNNWHWQYKRFIKPTLEKKANIKAAKLVKENGDYFLHVSFGFEVPKVYKPAAYLGIDRGVLFSMAYGLVDENGSIIEMGHKDDPFREIRIRAAKRVQQRQKRGLRITKKDYKQRELDGILHRLVNEMLDLAVKHKAMIVFEDLNIRNFGKFYKSAYEKMYKFTEYKAAWQGAPIYSRRGEDGKKKPGVWAAYSSIICIHCGEDVARDDRVVACANCGAVEHSDDAAGVNIARRALYRAKDWSGGNGKTGDYRAFHRSFANGAGFSTKTDLRKGGGVG